MYVNKLISDLHKEVNNHFYIKESATYEPCLVMELNASLCAVLPFKFKYYSASYIASVALSISKFMLA